MFYRIIVIDEANLDSIIITLTIASMIVIFVTIEENSHRSGITLVNLDNLNQRSTMLRDSHCSQVSRTLIA